MATKRTSSTSSSEQNAVVKVTDEDGRVHFTARNSPLAVAPGAKVSEVTASDAELSTPGKADDAGAVGS